MSGDKEDKATSLFNKERILTAFDVPFSFHITHPTKEVCKKKIFVDAGNLRYSLNILNFLAILLFLPTFLIVHVFFTLKL